MPLAQFLHVEEGMKRVARSLPGIPQPQALVLRAATILGRDLALKLDNWLKPSGLSEMEFRALISLLSQDDGSGHPSDLCASLAQSPANVTRVSDSLVERGLITRLFSDHDRRRVVMKITAEGEQLVRGLLPQISDFMNGLFKDFTVAEQLRLLSDLKRMLGALDALPVPTPGEAAP